MEYISYTASEEGGVSLSYTALVYLSISIYTMCITSFREKIFPPHCCGERGRWKRL